MLNNIMQGISRGGIYSQFLPWLR